MATKANSKSGGVGEGEDGGDAPLLDLNEASVKKLIARAKKRGYITYDELNDALPQDQMSSEQIEDIMSALNEMGVNIVENEEAGEDGDDQRDDALARVASCSAGKNRPAFRSASIASSERPLVSGI